MENTSDAVSDVIVLYTSVSTSVCFSSVIPTPITTDYGNRVLNYFVITRSNDWVDLRCIVIAHTLRT